ncbi:MAG: hypothetical protein ACPL1A_03195 [Candidatus Kapaibacteriota bacterium]
MEDLIKLVRKIFPLISLLALFSCNELPTDVGFKLINDTITVKVLSSDTLNLIYKTETLEKSPSVVNASILFCGVANQTEALSIIRFAFIPDTLSYLTENDIISAKFFIYPSRYALGDTNNANFGFNVKKVENYWSVNSNWDSVSVPGFFSRDVGNYSGAIQLKDTMNSVSLDLDKKLITEWLQLRPDTNAAVINWGIALIPNPNSNVIYSFGGEGVGNNTPTKIPLIQVIYKDKNSNLDTFYLYSALNASFIKYPKPADDAILIQGGLDVRTNLYFDISQIPKLASISKMELELTLDKNKTILGNTTLKDVFRIDFVSDSLGAQGNYYYYASKIDSNSYVYRCPSVTSAAELWNRFDGKGKLQIRASDFTSQYQQLDKLVFYGLNDTDPSKRPKVKIIYTMQSKK